MLAASLQLFEVFWRVYVNAMTRSRNAYYWFALRLGDIAFFQYSIVILQSSIRNRSRITPAANYFSMVEVQFGQRVALIGIDEKQ